MVQRQELRTYAAFLSLASMVCILLSVFVPGIEWFGQQKLVMFEDAEESTIEISSVFTFGYLWTKQSIITELDQVIYQQDAYHWCDGTTQDMPAETQHRFCELQRMVYTSTLVYLVLAFTLMVTAIFVRPQLTRNIRRLFYMLAAISLVQVVAGSVVGWTWITIKSALEEYFSTTYIEVNVLRMNVRWGWYFAGFSGLAAAAVCLISLYLACSASVRGYTEKAAVRGEKPNVKSPLRQPHRGTKVIPPTGEVQMNALSPFTRYAVQAEEGEEGEVEGETPDQSVSGDGGPLNNSLLSSSVRRLPRGQWW